jgi:murein DD-endopeptidase MepM/ murein hydrolase activator NlpD
MKSMRILLIAVFIFMFPVLSIAARKSPVDGGHVTSGVGWRLDPFGSGRTVWHNGYDIAVPAGTPVYPTQAGTVYFAGNYKGYGNLVAVEHGKGYISLYGHNAEVLVKPGQEVGTTTVIALAGSTGRSTGPHVHYEIRQIPQLAKQRREQMEQDLKSLVQREIGDWVEAEVNGKGGPEAELYLPELDAK